MNLLIYGVLGIFVSKRHNVIRLSLNSSLSGCLLYIDTYKCLDFSRIPLTTNPW